MRRSDQLSRAERSAPGEGVTRIGLPALLALRRAAAALPLRSGSVQASQGGGYVSAFKGRGMEFDEVRPYQPGDDVRNIDWRATARRGRPYTKLFREERERPVLVCVDYRSSMLFATRRSYKAVIAAQLAALLAWSANNNGDRVGGLVFSDGLHRELRPQRGKAAVLHLLQELAGHPAWEQPATAAPQPLQGALLRLRRVARHGSLVFLISDFRGLDETGESYLRRLAAHSELVLVFVHDPLEAALPPPGRYRLTDDHRELELDTDDGRLRARYQQHFAERYNRLKQLAQGHGRRLISCATADDPMSVLRQGLSPPNRNYGSPEAPAARYSSA